MNKLLNDCLFSRDKKSFESLREKANSFNSNFNGRNIIQDDIFRIMSNYAQIKEMPLEILRFPVSDKELCACTFVREGRIFVLINTEMLLSKQIFAAAHELYHIYCLLDDENQDLVFNGSILESKTIEESTTKEEELMANAFAGLLLVPSDILNEQLNIYKIRCDALSVKDVLMLMEIFAVPYKAMILRLYEDKLITEKYAEKMLAISNDELMETADITGLAQRFSVNTCNICQFGGLAEYMAVNEMEDNVMPSRLQSDKAILQEIKSKILKQE